MLIAYLIRYAPEGLAVTAFSILYRTILIWFMLKHVRRVWRTLATEFGE